MEVDGEWEKNVYFFLVKHLFLKWELFLEMRICITVERYKKIRLTILKDIKNQITFLERIERKT